MNEFSAPDIHECQKRSSPRETRGLEGGAWGVGFTQGVRENPPTCWMLVTGLLAPMAIRACDASFCTFASLSDVRARRVPKTSEPVACNLTNAWMQAMRTLGEASARAAVIKEGSTIA